MLEQAEPVPFVESVFHATDFSSDSEKAFYHALAIALLRSARLTVMNTGPGPMDRRARKRYPGVRETLERWDLLPPRSPRSAVYDKLGIRVRKVASDNRNTVNALAEYLDDHPTDLLVLSTESGAGLPRWLHGSVAESIARRSDTMTLFIPTSTPGFVSADGDLRLSRILVAMDHDPDPRAAFVYATRIALITGEPEAEVHTLHVGETAPAVPAELSADPRIPLWHHRCDGDPVERILSLAEKLPADLIVTTGRTDSGVFGATANSTTLGILHRAGCPVLAVPDRRP